MTTTQGVTVTAHYNLSFTVQTDNFDVARNTLRDFGEVIDKAWIVVQYAIPTPLPGGENYAVNVMVIAPENEARHDTPLVRSAFAAAGHNSPVDTLRVKRA